MVGPQAKREAVNVVMSERRFGVTHACGLVSISRSLYRYVRRSVDGELRQRIESIAADKRRYGYRRVLMTNTVLVGLAMASFILMTPGQVTIIAEWSSQVRRVFTDGRGHPPADDLDPTFNGHSIGHWEGKTLVIDTIGFNGRGALLGPVQKSDKTHVVERMSWSADGKVLTDQFTMEDPVSLAKPWTTTLVFDRMADTEERFEVWCEVDLDAFKTLDLPSLKDADPEVALMLDPDKRATDPALKIAAPAK